VADTADPQTPAHEATQRKAQREGKWALLGFGGSQMLRLGSNLVLTRLIPREAFGVFLVVRFVLMAIGQFSDVGVAASIIQSKRDDERFLNTAWTLQVVRGLVLTTIAAAVAWPAAAFFGMPELFGLVPFAGLVGVIGGFNSTRLLTLNRTLEIKRLTLLDFGSQLIGTGVTLVWAFLHPTVWALAAGGVAAGIGKAAMSHSLVPGLRNRFVWDREAASDLFRFGKWVFLSTLLGFTATQADRVVFGKLFPAAELGVYAIATLIAFTPQQVFRHIVLSVSFPLYSQTVRDGGDLPRVFRAGRQRVLLLGGLVCSLMLGGGPTIIDFLYPPEYAAAGWMVQMLAVATWFNALQVTIEAATLARGDSRTVAVSNAVKIAIMAVMIAVGFLAWGIPGAIAGFALSEVPRFIQLTIVGTRAGLRGLGQELGYTGLMVAVAAVGWLATSTMRAADLPLVLEALALGLVCLLGWSPLALPTLRARLGR
jgi:O-antigen/teichoic acid export membrane protein